MSIISYSRFANFLKNKKNSDGLDVSLPKSALEQMQKTNDSKPFNVNRDVQGTRPWHSYTAKQNAYK